MWSDSILKSSVSKVVWVTIKACDGFSWLYADATIWSKVAAVNLLVVYARSLVSCASAERTGACASAPLALDLNLGLVAIVFWLYTRVL